MEPAWNAAEKSAINPKKATSRLITFQVTACVFELYKFGSNSDPCLTGYLPQMLPGVIVYGVQFDLNFGLSARC